MKKKITKGQDKVIGGVCSGLAEYFDMDVFYLRAGFLALMFFTNVPAVIIYFILYISLSEKNSGN